MYFIDFTIIKDRLNDTLSVDKESIIQATQEFGFRKTTDALVTSKPNQTIVRLNMTYNLFILNKAVLTSKIFSCM